MEYLAGNNSRASEKSNDDIRMSHDKDLYVHQEQPVLVGVVQKSVMLKELLALGKT